MRRAMDLAVYLVVRIFICVVQALRMETAEQIARTLAWLAHRVFRIRRHVIEENLCCAFPHLGPAERERLIRRMWEHLFLLVVEVAHAPRKIHQTNWRDYIQLGGKDVLVRLLLSDRPVIIVTGHFGNFELAGVMLGLLGFPTYTVARTLDNPYLDRFVNRFRGLSGQFIIPKKGGYDQIVQVMSAGGTMSFLADQHAGSKGCWVEFFGRPASAHKAIALLAMTYNAPMVVGYCRRRGRPLHLEMRVHAVADPQQAGPELASVKALTQWYTSRLEEFIRQWPEQYWWLHRRWRQPPSRLTQQEKKAA
ncbi:MAG: lysophospholipid acyltransferase family protein [Thermoguttaceae bacterium]|nr:lysophospholipid acyltransferase family protein [Thermoguttaceae bacterium]MDW8038122.1 lysophospholipid acyltransferase family protein [Thermoguttaceae bacterium]